MDSQLYWMIMIFYLKVMIFDMKHSFIFDNLHPTSLFCRKIVFHPPIRMNTLHEQRCFFVFFYC